MNKSSPALLVFLLLCAAGAVQGLYYFPLLPDRVASHFDLSGSPNGFMTRSLFIEFYFIVTGICALLLPGIACGLPAVPPSLINLPNKGYWLSPNREAETFGYIRRQMLWFSCATMALLIDVFHQTFQVNIGREQSLTHLIPSLVLYLAFSIAWTASLIAKFKKAR